MATTQSTISNYAGKDAGRIFGKAFKDADTIQRGLISIYENVNYKLNMRLIDYADGTKAYSCIADGGFTNASDGAITLTEKVLEPVKLMLPLELCLEEYRQTWSEDSMGASAHNPNFPRDIEEALKLEVLKKTAERTDRVIWTGDNAVNSNEWTGFIPLWTADANVIKPDPLAAAITPDNVLAEFDKVTKAIPYSLRRKSLVFAISPDVADAYVKMLIKAGSANGLGGNANTNLIYGRYTLEVVNGLPDNTIAIFQTENLAFGTGTLGDHNEIKTQIDEFRDVLMMKMVYNGGVQYANSEEIVFYQSI